MSKCVEIYCTNFGTHGFGRVHCKYHHKPSDIYDAYWKTYSKIIDVHEVSPFCGSIEERGGKYRIIGVVEVSDAEITPLLHGRFTSLILINFGPINHEDEIDIPRATRINRLMEELASPKDGITRLYL